MARVDGQHADNDDRHGNYVVVFAIPTLDVFVNLKSGPRLCHLEMGIDTSVVSTFDVR